MEWLYQLELQWIVWIQQLGAWLIEPMRLVTLTGTEDFFMLLMPVVYWSIDSVHGIRMAVLLLLSNGLGTVAKMLAHAPRPYWLGSQVQAFSVETSFGFPSGHAQNAVAIWGYLATQVKQQAWKIALVVLVIAVGVSRIYLGMHFISDVIGGWLLGWLLVLVVLRLEPPARAWLSRLSLAQQMAVGLVSATLLGGLILLAAIPLQNWELPQEWLQNALAAAPDEPIDPGKLDNAFTLSGTWLGMWVGVAWLYHRQGGYRADGTPGQRLLRYLVGLAGVFFFWFVLGKIFPREADFASYALRLLRYILIGLWISALAPLLFEKLGLTSTKTAKAASLPASK